MNFGGTNRLIILSCFLLLFAHFIMAFSMVGPYIIADETGYLAIARFLSGTFTIPSQFDAAFSYYGYSLFLIPSFLVFRDPATIYQGVLLSNAMLLLVFYIALYHILHRIFHFESSRSLFAALITSCYPAFMLQSNYAWSENAFFPFYALSIIAFFRLLVQRNMLWSILYSFNCVFLYMIHGRGLLIMIVASIMYLILWKKDIIRWNIAVTGLITTIALFFVTKYIIHIILENVYSQQGGANSNSVAYAKGVVTFLFNEPTAFLKEIIVSVMGQVWYLIAATYGLFLLAVFYFLNKLPALMKTDEDESKTAFISLYILLSSVAIFAASVAPFGTLVPSSMWSDFLVYGRYNEGFIALFIAIGIMYYLRDTQTVITVKKLVIVMLIFMLCTIMVKMGRTQDYFSRPMHHLNVFGIISWTIHQNGFDMAMTTVKILAIMLTLLIIQEKKALIAVMLIAVLFAHGTIQGYYNYVYPTNAMSLRYKNAALQLEKHVKADVLFIDNTAIVPWGFGLQYWLPKIRFERGSLSRGDFNKSGFILTADESSIPNTGANPPINITDTGLKLIIPISSTVPVLLNEE